MNGGEGNGRAVFKKELWAWALYDFANSPFATTILAVVFNVYFAGVVARDAPVHGVTLWSFLVTGSAILSGLLSPLLGALADIRQRRKSWLGGCAVLGALSTAALVAAGPETLVWTCVLFVFASTCFSLSLTFYHSFLNDLSTGRNRGSISGFGWAVGYLGGGLCLALNLAMIQYPAWFNLPAVDHWPVRASFLLVGVWWLIFTLPIMIWTKESPAKTPVAAPVSEAVRRVLDNLKSATGYRKNVFLFLIAYLVYNDVIETIIVMAAIFAAAEIGMAQGEIVACFLMIQFVAFFGALAFGRLADRWSNKKALQASLVLWTLILLWTMVMKSKSEFWAAGVAVALVLGGSQAVSRSLFGSMVPDRDKAQFYGFWGLSGKISSALGPLVFGLVNEFTGRIRWAIFSMLVLLILGQGLLAFVKEPDADGPHL